MYTVFKNKHLNLQDRKASFSVFLFLRFPPFFGLLLRYDPFFQTHNVILPGFICTNILGGTAYAKVFVRRVWKIRGI